MIFYMAFLIIEQSQGCKSVTAVLMIAFEKYICP